jgi:AcrR family transcriptional regulator
MSNREEAKHKRRRQIVRDARALMQKTGDTGFSMRALAEQAGVSIATPYNLFGSKQTIMFAVLDDDLVDALRVLTGEPADLTSTDGFLSDDHRLPHDVRARLLDCLDLFGIAHGVLALRQGADAAELPAGLRRLSRIDRVVARLAAAGAEVRYRRVRSTLTRLRALAAHDVPALADFLAGDDAVLAVMAAAVDVVQAAGLTVDTGDEPSAHLRRARHWHRYSGGPVNAVHRDCATDICRGSLRLLRHAEAR